LAPRGEICPLRGMFTPSFTPWGEHSLLFRRMEQRISAPGDNFNPQGTKFTLGGQLRPWGSKFAPGGEIKNGPLITSGPGGRACSCSRFQWGCRCTRTSGRGTRSRWCTHAGKLANCWTGNADSEILIHFQRQATL
jgi:hypothetical protein